MNAMAGFGRLARAQSSFGVPFTSDRFQPLPPQAVELARLAVAVCEVLADEDGASSEEAQVALACAMLNRMRRFGPDEGGGGAAARAGVADFGNPAFCRAFAVACLVMSGDCEDPTGGATHFHHHRKNPKWARRAEPRALIGAHVFYVLG
ncbi:MAG: cell wall hydrolase [Parvibaculum sp.]|nr:cell wall hydrolase [Parvibaculum sp.]